MTYAVLIRFDPAGACPFIVREDSESLPGGEDVRYRLVAETDDYGCAIRVADEILRKCRAGEVRRR